MLTAPTRLDGVSPAQVAPGDGRRRPLTQRPATPAPRGRFWRIFTGQGLRPDARVRRLDG
ncbi:hypothetical protein [Amycolatopsis sp. CA-128772]|uniref:hypothetical protein n=1 Tax=Amycolatopsis sp. CA-128772 TaxID=2073159 RepID=UPI0011B08A1C|nr:hypothetical protein [Amycolatopsis sp. CA-128772]